MKPILGIITVLMIVKALSMAAPKPTYEADVTEDTTIELQYEADACELGEVEC